ncbi:hypothetical protein INT44_000080 [Umbelopsis vinacea]|uniref:Yeast cell wall synthesis Kre9/Knh1-like N-terminal domain-containing protein n=1 Tax=Umbelopsis vinacea TaxID=44442 RepID=A0A8H7PHA1_9FUNG|nr:hypothetical protein INT44_000080 [Umbelopsis vinacea]
MRLTGASLCLIGFFVQQVASVSLSYPWSGSTLTAGISFQVNWNWDALPTSKDDGSMDILLVSDILASKVVAVLDSNVATSGISTSATVPLNTTNGAYYIQLKVTSGNEKSAVNGPFSINGGSQSSSSSQTSSTATHTVTNASTTYNSSESPSLPTGIIVAISIISVVVVVAGIGGTMFWWRKRNRLIEAITTKYENEAKYYDRQAQMNDMQPTGGGSPPPTSPTVGSYNQSYQNANALSTETNNYVSNTNYAVDQQNQIPLQSPPAYYPAAHVHTPATAYPMPMPVPFVRQQEEPYHQHSIYDGYASNAQNPAMTDSSRIEVGTISSAPNTNDTSSLLNSTATQSSIRHVPHTPDEIITSSPHLNDEPQSPHTK